MKEKKRMRAQRAITEAQTLAALLCAVGEGAPSLDEKLGMLKEFRAASDAGGNEVDRLVLTEFERVSVAVEQVRRTQEELRNVLGGLTQPPAFPALCLGVAVREGVREAVVFHGGAARVVCCLEGVDLEGLEPGQTVLLNHSLNVVIGRSPVAIGDRGETASFERYAGENLAVVRLRDEELLVKLVGEAAAEPLTKDDRIVVSRESWVGVRRLPKPAAEDHFLSERPKATWDDIGGLDKEIAEVQRSIRLRRFHPDIAAKYHLPPLRSILLEGPPGTGKTMIAGALANWLGELSGGKQARFIYVKPSALHSMWYSQSEANYREIFRLAREAGEQDPAIPVVIYFDELDSAGAMRGSSLMAVDDRVVQAFAAELDGLSDRGNILVVGSTNRRGAIDPALLRPGRFGDCVIRIPRPNMKAARDIFFKHFKKELPYAGGMREEIVECAVSRLYSPNGEAEVAEVMLRDGKRQTIRARDLISGASIAKICRIAIEQACERELAGGEAGLRLEDALEGIGQELETMAATLTPANCRQHVEGLPQDVDVVKVEPARRKPLHPHRYLNHV